MKSKILYPGSIGEIVQGNYNTFDVLLSFPINLFTKVEVYECKNPKLKYNYNKMNIFMENILKKWNCQRYLNTFEINSHSNIPIGKGFASSTADLCATYHCLLKLFNKQFNEYELMHECLKIEPTDSILFKNATLFDYKNGKYKKSLGKYLKFYILVFEGDYLIDTIKFNKNILIPCSSIGDLISPLHSSILKKDISTLAAISTESIIRNQHRLNYTVLNTILKINKKVGGLGIIGAHSGNMLGIIFKDKEKLNYALKNSCSLKGFKKYSLETLSNINLKSF